MEFKASSEYNNEYGAKKAVKGGYWSSKRNAKPLPLYWWMSFKNEPVAIVSIAFGEHWKYMGAEFEFIASDKEECDENGKVLIKGTQAEIYGAVFTNEQSYYCYGSKITKLGRYGYASVKNFYYRPGKWCSTLVFENKSCRPNWVAKVAHFKSGEYSWSK